MIPRDIRSESLGLALIRHLRLRLLRRLKRMSNHLFMPSRVPAAYEIAKDVLVWSGPREDVDELRDSVL